MQVPMQCCPVSYIFKRISHLLNGNLLELINDQKTLQSFQGFGSWPRFRRVLLCTNNPKHSSTVLFKAAGTGADSPPIQTSFKDLAYKSRLRIYIGTEYIIVFLDPRPLATWLVNLPLHIALLSYETYPLSLGCYYFMRVTIISIHFKVTHDQPNH